jgi:hypothetical protein
MDINNIKREIQKIKLTSEEKGEIFEHVMASPTPSPYASILSKWKFVSRPLVYVFASLFILIIRGGLYLMRHLDQYPGISYIL